MAATSYTVAQGPIDTGSWVTNQRPQSWRDGIQQLFPNGSVALTSLTSKMNSEKVTDYRFNWWARAYPAQAGTTTDVYTNTGLSSAATGSELINSTVYVKCAEAVASEFRARHTVLIRRTDDHTKDCHGIVTDVQLNGANSYVGVRLNEAGTSALAATTPRIIKAGSSQQENAEQPDSIVYLPEQRYNFCQTVEESVEISRRAMATRLRTGSSYQDQKKMAFLLHLESIERMFIWGERAEFTLGNKTASNTRGVLAALSDWVPDNVSHYPSSAWSTASWLTGGWDWLDQYMRNLFKHKPEGGSASTSRLAFCGYGALSGLNRLAKAIGQLNIEVGATAFGLKVVKWITPYGVINLFPHPLFNLESSEANTILVIEPRYFKYRYITDTHFKADRSPDQGGKGTTDGKQESWLTDCGLEIHYPEMCAYLTGVGEDGNDA